MDCCNEVQDTVLVAYKKEQFVQYKKPLIYMFGDSKRTTFPKLKKKLAVLVSYSEWLNKGIATLIHMTAFCNQKSDSKLP